MARSGGTWSLLCGFSLAGVLAAGFLLNPTARGADPAYYQRRATWHETMFAARDSLSRSLGNVGAAATVDFTSPVVRGGEPARRVEIPLAGVRELTLYVEGAPEVTYGAGTWADPQVIDQNGRMQRLCHLKSLEVLAGEHDIDVNLKSGVSGPLRIAGQPFEHGIHVNANSRIRVRLDGPFERLVTWIGIDDWVGPKGAVRFRVASPPAAARHDLWELTARDFSDAQSRREMRWEQQDLVWDLAWQPGDFRELARRYAEAGQRVLPASGLSGDVALQEVSLPILEQVRTSYLRAHRLAEVLQRARQLDFRPLRMAIADLRQTFPTQYADGEGFAQRLQQLEAALVAALAQDTDRDLAACERVAELLADFEQLQREALLANPLLDFEEFLVIRRVPDGDPRRATGRGYGVGEYIGLPRQSSKCNPGIEQPFAWDNEIATVSLRRPRAPSRTLYHSEGNRLLTDVDLHWDADRLLFSMPGSHDKWHVFEMGSDGRGLRQLTPTDQPDVDYYDSCYLPNGDIAFVSTAPLQGVPCNAGVIVGMMYQMDGNGQRIRQICFEQDHSYCPSVLNDGRLLYLRWDYTDTPHVWNRILFSMNPDGTGQREYYGSNSYWPNSVFFARAVPNHASKVVGIVTGHHVGRVGELVIFDPERGTHEAKGVVQRIPGYGQKVEPLIEDKLTQHSWPKFTYPVPLSEKYFLAAAKPTEDALWGIYLVDVFDNMVLLREEEGLALLEPIPLRKVPRPPVIPSFVQPERQDATVYLRDVYAGPGLAGIPRGSVQKLRVFTYHFGYQQLAGIDHRVGADGPWEVKRVLGTVPVESDGSAFFRIPAKTPISVQPLDKDGKALALMRSWMTAMPGETLSCAGCHEQRREIPLDGKALALKRTPAEITPWFGPTRGFSFHREVQPVLDKYCVACHNGSPRDDGLVVPDLRADQGYYVVFRSGDPEPLRIHDVAKEELVRKYKAVFEPSYVVLRSLVRVGGLESDLHLLPPMEFHADTSELFQMLRKGHYNVQLDAEAWERLVTWVDLNAPCHGTWSEFTTIPRDQRAKRVELQQAYGGVAIDHETIAPTTAEPVVPILPPDPFPVPQPPLFCADWPWTAAEAQRRQDELGTERRTIDLGDGVTIEMVHIPAGSFILGNPQGGGTERPATVVRMERPFWMSRCEITNRQYQQFDRFHDSRFEHRTSWIFSEEYLGWLLNGPSQPVVRVSWDQAVAFCNWLTAKTGAKFQLPSEAEWEFACRAGTDSPFHYGDLDVDFGTWANLADVNIRKLAYEAWRPKPPDIVPRDGRFDDGMLVTADVGSYQPNAWGLCDMHGNVAEWTRTTYADYPYRESDGRNDPANRAPKVVRGGSWRDRPKLCGSAQRWRYEPYQRVYNVGFRIVCASLSSPVALDTRDNRSGDHD